MSKAKRTTSKPKPKVKAKKKVNGDKDNYFRSMKMPKLSKKTIDQAKMNDQYGQ